nr:MAG TPA: hypothetical protein [Caudoviricetes sp.]
MGKIPGALYFQGFSGFAYYSNSRFSRMFSVISCSCNTFLCLIYLYYTYNFYFFNISTSK